MPTLKQIHINANIIDLFLKLVESFHQLPKMFALDKIGKIWNKLLGFGNKSISMNSQISQPEITIRTYVVCLIDILGQSNKLSEWSRITKEELHLEKTLDAQRRKLLPTIQNTAGIITEVKKTFCEYFNGYYGNPQCGHFPVPDGVNNDNWMKMLDEYSKRKKAEHDHKVSIQSFSDTIVFYAPLVLNELDQYSIFSLLGMIQACAFTMFLTIPKNIFFRGGISCNQALFYDDIGFYGPALSEAYRIESKIAQYPRIVVSNDLIDISHKLVGRANTELEKRVLSATNRLIDQFLYKDTKDHEYCVDFMGNTVYEIMRKCHTHDKLKEHAYLAYCHVCDEENKFLNKDPDKLGTRYKRLSHYMKSRLPIWGLEHLTRVGWA